MKAGDTIGIFSPASPGITEDFDASVVKLRSMGFKVREGRYARSVDHYFAGSDIQRAEDFNSFIGDEAISALLTSRGGYGCSRILPLIDYKAVRAHPKIIAGGSDLTALLWAIHQKTGLVTFFAPMALQIGRDIDQYSLEFMIQSLTGQFTGLVKLPAGYNPYALRKGETEGRLIGGCLSLVVSLLGTEYFGDIDGRILFLEEVGEQPFRIDRMLTHLRNAGVFRRISGLILGDFQNCWPGDGDSLELPEIIEQVLADTNIPVMAGLPFGHGDVKLTLPLGIDAYMDAEAGILEFKESGVG